MKKIEKASSRFTVAFCAYLLASIIVTFFYVFTFGYSFWGTDKGGIGLDFLAWIILLIIVILQFQARTRVWSWLILPPSYVFVLLVLSNLERFNIDVVYLGFMVTGIMMALAALLNWYHARSAKI